MNRSAIANIQARATAEDFAAARAFGRVGFRAVFRMPDGFALAPGQQADLLIKPWEAREMLGLPQIPGEPPEGAEEAFGENLPPLLPEGEEPPLGLPSGETDGSLHDPDEDLEGSLHDPDEDRFDLTGT